MTGRTYVIGVGLTKFEKPGGRDWDYPDMAREAGTAALADAGIGYERVEQAALAYCYGDSTSGQRALYEIGLSGIPAFNVNNNCATGSTALWLARQTVAGETADCVLALGFEKMQRGSLREHFEDRTSPTGRHLEIMAELHGRSSAPAAAQLFGNAGREHMNLYGTTAEQFARVAEKNHRHSVDNPYAQFRTAYTFEEIRESAEVFSPLTKLQCCPTSDGAAAAVVASERFVDTHGLGDRAVEISAMTLVTDTEATFDDRSCISLVGARLSHAAARRAYTQAGVGPEDIDVIELHDCFSCNELITYEALGLCEPGGGGALIDSGAVTYGGKWVVNPSGGLISKGHPLGATGLAQCAELTWQLRGDAGARQVRDARIALQHNIGVGGAAVVAIYQRSSP